jgi:uncharacterized membrane protein YdbT with pleckstrin-like domain
VRYLEPGEEIVYEERPHSAALAGPLLRALVLTLLGAALVLGGSALTWGLSAAGALLLGVAAFMTLVEVWRWDRTHVVVTTEKLFVVSGLAQRRAAAVRLARAGVVEMEQDTLGRMLGYGTISAGNLEIPYVADPDRVCALAG